LISLISPDEFTVGNIPLINAIRGRQSWRTFKDETLTLEELSFLLWATQGIREVSRISTKRVVPSGRARQGFETYLIINWVEGLEKGIYRYLPIEHKLLLISKGDQNLSDKLVEACFNQKYIGKSAVVFVWAAYPYRMEWSLGIRAHKDILIEAGHICQNLYLASEAINCGTCAIGLYNQNLMDQLIGADGENEFTAYLAPVGKIPK
jgi:SagB-type dehydrogenase family enzyme